MRINNVELVKRSGIMQDDVINVIGEYGVYSLTGKQIEDLLIEQDRMCGDCGDSGEVQEDEYENGQISGVRTVTRNCPQGCEKKIPFHDKRFCSLCACGYEYGHTGKHMPKLSNNNLGHE